MTEYESNPTQVRYPEYISGESLTVEQLLTASDVEAAAPELQDLVGLAYANSYEKPQGPLALGTVATRYGQEHVDGFVERAVNHHLRGSRFWVARDPARRIIGYAKTSPGETLDEPKPGVVYVNDVVVAPATFGRANHQRRGHGIALLHAALKYGDYDKQQPVVLDAFDASEDRLQEGYIVPGPNQLYRKYMGLLAVGRAKPFAFPNGYELSMTEYQTPPRVTLGGVVLNMERSRPPLKLAEAT